MRLADGVLKQEVKWAHYPDTVYHLYDFAYMLKRYAKHQTFLEYVWYWFCSCNQAVRDAMDTLLQRVEQVRFFVMVGSWRGRVG